MEESIDNYELIRCVGKGGMGEVFLAKDPICSRNVALKKMASKWSHHPIMRERFLQEAKVAAKLCHPSIIPIYTIDPLGNYYTMPYIEGKTLKEILSQGWEFGPKMNGQNRIAASLPSLVRIFFNIAEAIAYTHSRGILHRDLKPENIIVGTFGEVIILDWGLAHCIGEVEGENKGLSEEHSPPTDLTQPGKIPGTLLYMAPERAFGGKSSPLTDIYSLGVILYQILTLGFPFQRRSLKEFRKMAPFEEIIRPEEVAPDRDISPHLSHIAQKCLEKEPSNRYQSVSALIKELENYIEGVPEWLDTKELRIDKREDWQFQENISLTKHMALSRGIEMVSWFNLMISKAPFPGNIRIDSTLTLREGSKGISILFSIPESDIQQGIDRSYCLWLSLHHIRLYRSNVEVCEGREISLEPNFPHKIQIVLIENHVHLSINGIQCFDFLSHIPMPGSRIGLLIQDDLFSLPCLTIAVATKTIQVNCLAIPDAFLARRDYDEAIKEYRKIADSFPGRAEGHEATFRAGTTLIKQGENQKRKKEKQRYFSLALEEFEKLHQTPGAPLEQLGKSMVYRAEGDFEEEVKCLELALRKFPKHPLRPVLVENILFRLYESTQRMRYSAYLFALLVLRHLPELPESELISKLLDNYLEPLPFFVPAEEEHLDLIIQLAFWLNRPLVLSELIEKGLPPKADQNAQVGLILLGYEELADLSVLDRQLPEMDQARFEYALNRHLPLEPNGKGIASLWNALEKGKWKEAHQLLIKVPPEERLDEKSPYFFLSGCLLSKERGKSAGLAHLTNVPERTYPLTWSLCSHYLMGRIDLKKGWMTEALYFEKLRLAQQLYLYSRCVKNPSLEKLAKLHIKKLL